MYYYILIRTIDNITASLIALDWILDYRQLIMI